MPKLETPEDRFGLSECEKEARAAQLRARFEAATRQPAKPRRLRNMAWVAFILGAVWLLANSFVN